VAVSQARLVEGVKAYKAGDCATANAKARASIQALGNRPEPFEVIGYCDAQAGFPSEAEKAMRAAIQRDPANWEYRYALALVRAAGGRDPRSDVRAARRLNPREPRVRDALARLRPNDPQGWRVYVREVGLPVPRGT
jgi:cytochrome c-type biogenesis protein CcmH/NrfG